MGVDWGACPSHPQGREGGASADRPLTEQRSRAGIWRTEREGERGPAGFDGVEAGFFLKRGGGFGRDLA